MKPARAIRLKIAAVAALLGLAAGGVGTSWPPPLIAPAAPVAVKARPSPAPAQGPLRSAGRLEPAPRPQRAASGPAEPAPKLAEHPPEQAREPEATPADLWRHWQRLLSRQAFQQIPILNALLAESLRSHDDPAVYREIAELLEHPEISLQAKSLLIDLLGEAATPEALELLLEIARQGGQSPLYGPSLNTISHIGDNHWGGRFHEELSGLLESAWVADLGDDTPLVRAVARALVGVGAPAGIQLLLDTLTGRNSGGDSRESFRRKQIAAFQEVPKVSNPAAIPVLVANLPGGGKPAAGGGEAADFGAAGSDAVESPLIQAPLEPAFSPGSPMIASIAGKAIENIDSANKHSLEVPAVPGPGVAVTGSLEPGEVAPVTDTPDTAVAGQPGH
jgi:hypothetical protein